MTEHGWKHDALADDLAQYLQSEARMVWADMQIGPAGSPRPDVYTIERSYSKPMPTAYECKISRSDLRSDTTSGKWQKYLAFAGAVIFAVPDGLCTLADIPSGCGLIVRKAQVWRHVRKATRTPVALPMDASMKLLIDGVTRTIGRRDPAPRRIELWTEHEAVRKKFGQAVAKAARDLAGAQDIAKTLAEQRKAGWERVDREIEAHRRYRLEQVRKEMAEFEAAKRDLVEWLGLDADASIHVVRRALTNAKTSCDVDARVQLATRQLSMARQSVEQALGLLDAAKPAAAWAA